MTPVCPSCLTVTATPGVQLTEADRTALLRELGALALMESHLSFAHDTGRHGRVLSFEQGVRAAQKRREAFGGTALGRLYAMLGGAR